MPKVNVKVKLIGKDGNAWVLMGLVADGLKKAGRKDLVKEFMDEAMSGDYNNLLRVCMEYVEVY